MKTELSTTLQAAGVNATAYAAKLAKGKNSVIILNKDAAADLEVELDFGHDASGALETKAFHAPARQPRSAHHNVNEDRIAQAGQVHRHCSPRNGTTRDGELNR